MIYMWNILYQNKLLSRNIKITENLSEVLMFHVRAGFSWQQQSDVVCAVKRRLRQKLSEPWRWRWRTARCRETRRSLSDHSPETKRSNWSYRAARYERTQLCTLEAISIIIIIIILITSVDHTRKPWGFTTIQGDTTTNKKFYLTWLLENT